MKSMKIRKLFLIIGIGMAVLPYFMRLNADIGCYQIYYEPDEDSAGAEDPNDTEIQDDADIQGMDYFEFYYRDPASDKEMSSKVYFKKPEEPDEQERLKWLTFLHQDINIIRILRVHKPNDKTTIYIEFLTEDEDRFEFHNTIYWSYMTHHFGKKRISKGKIVMVES